MEAWFSGFGTLVASGNETCPLGRASPNVYRIGATLFFGLYLMFLFLARYDRSIKLLNKVMSWGGRGRRDGNRKRKGWKVEYVHTRRPVGIRVTFQPNPPPFT